MLTKTEGGATPVFHLLSGDINTVCNIDDATNERNIRSSMKRGLPDFFDHHEIGKFKSEPIAIVGGGCTLDDTFHELREFRNIMVCGSAHDYLISKGFKPKYAVMCDGDQNYYGLINRDCEGCSYLLASSCDPSLYDHLAGRDVFTWNTAMAVSNEKFAELGIKRRIGTGCMAVLSAIPMSILLGYTNLHFFGFDSCKKHDWHAYRLNPEHDQERTEVLARVGQDKTFVTSVDFLAQAKQFQEIVKNYGSMFDFTIHGDGLIAAMHAQAKIMAEDKA